MRVDYEIDDKTFDKGGFKVKGYSGIAWHVLGWELQETEETEWTGTKERTGNVVAVMIGDDRYFTFDPEDIIPLDDGTYCFECGQIGCFYGARE